MENPKFASLVILVGSLLFLVAAFMPYTRVFAEPDPEKKLAIIQKSSAQWDVGHVLFILSSLITALGLTLMIRSFGQSFQPFWVWLAALALVLGAVLWSWHCLERLVSPEGFVQGENTAYLFLLYSILTMAGLLVMGLFLLRTGLPAWLGWMLIGGTTLVAVLMIVFKDMPPFVYYVFTLVLGIRLLTLVHGS